MAKISLVALYGAKPTPFQSLLESIWQAIADSAIGPGFKPYALEQVHSTLIGMESLPDSYPPINSNRWKKLHSKTEMNFAGFADRVTEAFPMSIQIGGFEASYDGFISLGALPYVRSFQVNWQARRVILMGWPMEEGRAMANQKLLNFREAMDTHHHIRHKYEGDNDFYLVLGQLESLDSYSESERIALQVEVQRLEASIRNQLAQGPLVLNVTKEEISLVRYVEETLDLDTSEKWPISKKDHDFIRDLYK